MIINKIKQWYIRKKNADFRDTFMSSSTVTFPFTFTHSHLLNHKKYEVVSVNIANDTIFYIQPFSGHFIRRICLLIIWINWSKNVKWRHLQTKLTVCLVVGIQHSKQTVEKMRSYNSFSSRLLMTWLPLANGWSCLLHKTRMGGLLLWTTASDRIV